MQASILSQILFILSLLLLVFMPGYFLLLAIFGKNKIISPLEKFIFSFGLGIIIVDFIAFFYNKIHLPITASTSLIGVFIFSFLCLGIFKIKSFPKNKVSFLENNLFSFSKNQIFLICLLLLSIVFIKTAYLTSTVTPTATDMGHHMYWAKLMTQTHQLPAYNGMPDFIIGEHIAIAEIAMLSKASFFSAFPVVFLLIVNLLGILTMFVLTLRIFKKKSLAILTLLFLGVLFAVSSPQAKFISGGVVGNILGNFLMPLAFYFYWRAFEHLDLSSTKFSEKIKSSYSKSFLALAIFSTFGLFYTHHLTSFIFLFITLTLIVLFLLINFREIRELFSKIKQIVFTLPVILTFLLGLTFFFFIFTPNYIKNEAVKTAVGAPSKSTRGGLTINNLKSSVGEARLALGFIGLILLLISYKRKNIGYALISSWTIMLLVMSLDPNILFINLPSNRIGNYLSYPLSILSALGFYSLFNPNFLSSISTKNSLQLNIPKKLISISFLTILTFILINGLSDSAHAFKQSSNFTPTIKTFDASKYLVDHLKNNDIVLKDHNYLSGDTWIKLFFMKGYRYPQSRSYFKRYHDPTKPREMCTLYMISNPGKPDAQKCFQKTKTDYLMVNPYYDSAQFKKLTNFDQVYNNGTVTIFHKK